MYPAIRNSNPSNLLLLVNPFNPTINVMLPYAVLPVYTGSNGDRIGASHKFKFDEIAVLGHILCSFSSFHRC